ncbi:MAG TPA: hypothetical protein VF100_01430 [Thermoanaerobaculia bacterium]
MRSGGGWAGFAAVAVAAIALLAAAGWLPMRRLAGADGVTAMLVACGINLAASLVAAVPVARAARRRGEGGTGDARGVVAALGAMAIRFVTVSAATVAAALAGIAPVAPLLVWAAVSYLVLLVVDTAWAVHTLGGSRRRGPIEGSGLVPRGTTETR